MTVMKTTYDKSADAVYIALTNIENGEVKDTYPCNYENLKGDINLDFSSDGTLLGIEILNAKNVLPASFLKLTL